MGVDECRQTSIDAGPDWFRDRVVDRCMQELAGELEAVLVGAEQAGAECALGRCRGVNEREAEAQEIVESEPGAEYCCEGEQLGHGRSGAMDVAQDGIAELRGRGFGCSNRHSLCDGAQCLDDELGMPAGHGMHRARGVGNPKMRGKFDYGARGEGSESDWLGELPQCAGHLVGVLLFHRDHDQHAVSLRAGAEVVETLERDRVGEVSIVHG
jgi:hypothetical protein